MRTESIVLAVASLALIAGCANRNRKPAPPPEQNPFWSITYADSDYDSQPPSVVHSSLTPSDEDREVEVGAVVYVDGVRTNTIEAVARLKAPVDVGMLAGHVIRLAAGDAAKLKTRRVGVPQQAGCIESKGSGRFAETLTACLIDKDNDGTFDVAMFEKYEKEFPLPAKVPYTVESAVTKSEVNYGAVQKELVYGGASNGSLRLTYREFTKDGMARQAFTQDLTYELDKRGGAEIGFRGLRITVLSATNRQIAYRVTRQMD